LPNKSKLSHGAKGGMRKITPKKIGVIVLIWRMRMRMTMMRNRQADTLVQLQDLVNV
jgi:hypothetical protein